MKIFSPGTGCLQGGRKETPQPDGPGNQAKQKQGIFVAAQEKAIQIEERKTRQK
jgi:hypothetical protein